LAADDIGQEETGLCAWCYAGVMAGLETPSAIDGHMFFIAAIDLNYS